MSEDHNEQSTTHLGHHYGPVAPGLLQYHDADMLKVKWRLADAWQDAQGVVENFPRNHFPTSGV